MSKIKPEIEEKIKEYIVQVMDNFADEIEKNGMSEGHDLDAYFMLNGTENNCRLAYTHLNSDPDDIFTFTINVYRRGTDRVYSQFDFTGTNDEFIEYVRKPVYDYEDYFERIVSMSDRADDFWE